MPHPPHKLADGSADTHADDCPRCLEIFYRYMNENGPVAPHLKGSLSVSKRFFIYRPAYVAIYMSRANFNRIDAQFDAEDEAERADEARLRDLQNACGVNDEEASDEQA